MPIPSFDQIRDAIGGRIGGMVVKIERQLRWRPTWFIDVERDGETVPVVLRGDRPDSQAFPLRHEYTFHQLMEQREFPVPHLYEYLEQVGGLDCVLMARVPGQPGFEGVTDADRDTVVDEYLQQLARLHQTDPAPFIEAGIMHPGPGQDSAMIGHGMTSRSANSSDHSGRCRHRIPSSSIRPGWRSVWRAICNAEARSAMYSTPPTSTMSTSYSAIDLQIGSTPNANSKRS